MIESHPVIERYLTRLSDNLSGLAPLDRQEVLQDIRSHLAEAMAAGKALDTAIESLGPADALARAYAVELLLNPRKHTERRDRLLRIAGLVAAGSLPVLLMVILLGGVGATLIATGVVAIIAGILDAFGALPSFVQTSGLPPMVMMLIGVAMAAVGILGIIGLRRFVRFVAYTWRALVPKTP